MDIVCYMDPISYNPPYIYVIFLSNDNNLSYFNTTWYQSLVSNPSQHKNPPVTTLDVVRPPFAGFRLACYCRHAQPPAVALDPASPAVQQPSSRRIAPQGLLPALTVPLPPLDDLIWWFQCKFWGIQWFLQPSSVVQVHVAASKCVIPIFFRETSICFKFQ